MNWYKLEAISDALRLDYQAELAPTVAGTPNVEVWKRSVDGEDYWAFLNYENQEFMCPEDSLVAAEEALCIRPPGELLANVKARGGLWMGPSPPERV